MIISRVLKSSKLEFIFISETFLCECLPIFIFMSPVTLNSFGFYLFVANLRQNQLLLQVTVSSFSLTPPWHYLWHFPPQRDRKYNRAVTKAPSAGQCGHFCGITKNVLHRRKYIKYRRDNCEIWQIRMFHISQSFNHISVWAQLSSQKNGQFGLLLSGTGIPPCGSYCYSTWTTVVTGLAEWKKQKVTTTQSVLLTHISVYLSIELLP